MTFYKLFGLFLVTLCLVYGVSTPKPRNTQFNYQKLKELPAMLDGRVQPLGTVARNALLGISGSAYPKMAGRTYSPIEWLAELFFMPEEAESRSIIPIHHGELKTILGLDVQKTRFSLLELRHVFLPLEQQYEEATKVEVELRDTYQKAVVALYRSVLHHIRLGYSVWIYDQESILGEWGRYEAFVSSATSSPDLLELFQARYREMETRAVVQIIPEGEAFATVGAAQLSSLQSGQPNEQVELYLRMADRYRDGDALGFNSALDLLYKKLSLRPERTKIYLETLLSDSRLLDRAIVAYLICIGCVLLASIGRKQLLTFIATYSYLLGLTLHTVLILTRMYIQGRPPVTNLYSSAIFVGWGCVFFAYLLERASRSRLGLICGGLAGALTLLVADALAVNGETLELMQPVLDSNFWLATHVTTITLGYSATILAGCIGVLYIIASTFVRMKPEDVDALFTHAYRVTLFALALSFVGTVLGGIWADQSWGRFWGWDPKENGALLVVLWNAGLLHSVIGRLCSSSQFLVYVTIGNIVTALSWFGVNMLGIGLHSYGFTEKTFTWLIIFCGSQLALTIWGGFICRKQDRSTPLCSNHTTASRVGGQVDG